MAWLRNSCRTLENSTFTVYDYDSADELTNLWHKQVSGSTTNTVSQYQYGYDNAGNRLMFTARDRDPDTGLYNYRYRYYSPTLGRFVQPDPVGIGGEDLNLYRYVENGPADGTDSFGREIDSVDATAGQPGDAGNIAREYLKEVAQDQARRKSANEFAKKVLKEVLDKSKELKGKLNKRTLDACQRELRGEVVKRKPSGDPFDHVKKVKDALQGVKNQISKLKEALNRDVSGSERDVLENHLKELQRLHDRALEALQSE